jgi:hypothetical protein
MPSSKEQVEKYRLKNERRKKKAQTLYAEEAREIRRHVGGAFGKEDPAVFNKLSEGTTAIRRAETDL